MAVRTLKGMTLMEMLVAIAIAAVAMQGFSLLLVRSLQLNKFNMEEGIASAAAFRGANRLVSDLRRARQGDDGSFPLVSGTSFDVKFYIDDDDDGVTERVHYYLQNGMLKKGVTNPTGTTTKTYPAGDDSTVVVTKNVVNTNSDPVFYYYNKNYPGDTTNNPLAVPVSVGQVRLIKVHLLVNIDQIRAPNNVNIESFADLRNLNDYE